MTGIYGIDLGTTYSAVAHIVDGDRAEIIKNADGHNITPSVVFFETEDTSVVGETAKNSIEVDSENVVATIKREMGNQEHRLDFHGTEYSPESISALILKKLVNDANSATGQDINRVVITVPAYFGVQEREATKNAAEIAGLDVVGLLPEPTAAAFSYGYTDRSQERTIFVFDLGGGTFDTTILRISETALETLVVEGDASLGGADWDEVLLNLALRKYAEEAEVSEEDVRDDFDFVAEQRVKVEDLKKKLSQRESVKHPMNWEGNRASIIVTREEFEEETSHLVARCAAEIQKTVEAYKGKGQTAPFDDVLLVGGSTRMPAIKAMVGNELNTEPNEFDPDEAVAKGAAVFGLVQKEFEDAITAAGGDPAAATEGGEEGDGGSQFLLGGGGVQPTMSVTTVLPRGIGIKFVKKDGETEYIGFIAHKNDTLPYEHQLQAGTVAEGQTQVDLHIYEQQGEEESEDLALNKELTPEEGAKLSWGDPLPVGSPINIYVSISDQGLISLRAEEPTTGQDITVEVSVETMNEEDKQAAKAGLQMMNIE